MSVCMRSAQAVPKRLFASSRTSTTPLSSPISTFGTKTRNVRWSSGKAGATEEGAKGKGKGKGWTGFSVLAWMGVSALGAGAWTRWQGEEKSGRMRDYSSPEKFVRPTYATIHDMEAVSALLNFSLKSTDMQRCLN
ncbi:hypothetical protein BDZ45DRAFT_61241 [Acephala macrosclerotiorum]|nr:hypothetical protein BDZ45DRAFT_61241 [Acephala macrosclerotiorum]